MGRNKIKIEKIQNDRVRTVTFNKRRKGLTKKTMELSLLCDTEILLAIMDKNNKCYVYHSHGNYNKFISKYLFNNNVLKEFISNKYHDVYATEENDNDEEIKINNTNNFNNSETNNITLLNNKRNISNIDVNKINEDIYLNNIENCNFNSNYKSSINKLNNKLSLKVTIPGKSSQSNYNNELSSSKLIINNSIENSSINKIKPNISLNNDTNNSSNFVNTLNEKEFNMDFQYKKLQTNSSNNNRYICNNSIITKSNISNDNIIKSSVNATKDFVLTNNSNIYNNFNFLQENNNNNVNKLKDQYIINNLSQCIRSDSNLFNSFNLFNNLNSNNNNNNYINDTSNNFSKKDINIISESPNVNINKQSKNNMTPILSNNLNINNLMNLGSAGANFAAFIFGNTFNNKFGSINETPLTQISYNNHFFPGSISNSNSFLMGNQSNNNNLNIFNHNNIPTNKNNNINTHNNKLLNTYDSLSFPFNFSNIVNKNVINMQDNNNNNSNIYNNNKQEKFYNYKDILTKDNNTANKLQIILPDSPDKNNKEEKIKKVLSSDSLTNVNKFKSNKEILTNINSNNFIDNNKETFNSDKKINLISQTIKSSSLNKKLTTSTFINYIKPLKEISKRKSSTNIISDINENT